MELLVGWYYIINPKTFQNNKAKDLALSFFSIVVGIWDYSCFMVEIQIFSLILSLLYLTFVMSVSSVTYKFKVFIWNCMHSNAKTYII